jgi:hypothetical protein
MQWSFSLNNFGVRLSLQSWRRCLRCGSVVVSSKGTHKVEQNLSASSQAVWAQATGNPGALLVSPFNVKWRFSAPAGGVEGSKFCLFLVILPARCVFSISPRFHYKRHAFCFLPLAAILEFPLVSYVVYLLNFIQFYAHSSVNLAGNHPQKSLPRIALQYFTLSSSLDLFCVAFISTWNII